MCRFLGYLFNFELIYEPLLKNKIKIVHTKFIILPSFNGKTTTASILFLEEACSGCSGNASLYWGINVPSFTAKMGPCGGRGGSVLPATPGRRCSAVASIYLIGIKACSGICQTLQPY